MCVKSVPPRPPRPSSLSERVGVALAAGACLRFEYFASGVCDSLHAPSSSVVRAALSLSRTLFGHLGPGSSRSPGVRVPYARLSPKSSLLAVRRCASIGRVFSVSATAFHRTDRSRRPLEPPACGVNLSRRGVRDFARVLHPHRLFAQPSLNFTHYLATWVRMPGSLGVRVPLASLFLSSFPVDQSVCADATQGPTRMFSSSHS